MSEQGLSEHSSGCKFQRKRERELSLNPTIFGLRKREIFQRKREQSTDFQSNRE